MTQYKFTIRKEMPKDYAEVENLVREAFWDVYAPGCDEHLIVHKLRGKDACLGDLSCVAVDENGRIVGQILYTKARIEHPDGKQWETAAFGPLGVLPEWQGRGVGGALGASHAGTGRKGGMERRVYHRKSEVLPPLRVQERTGVWRADRGRNRAGGADGDRIAAGRAERSLRRAALCTGISG